MNGGNISDRFPIRGNTTRGQGFCSIDSIELLNDEVVAVGSSDGKLRAVSILPNKVINEIANYESGIESLDINQITKQMVTTSDNVIHLYNYSEVKDKNSQKSNKSDFFAGLSN